MRLGIKKQIYGRAAKVLNWGQITQSGGQARVLSYKRHLTGKPSGKALLSFLTQPVVDELQGIITYQFSNTGLARTIPKVLNQLGYEVDIINWDDQGEGVSDLYDVAILHGGKNFENLKNTINHSKLIYLSTGSYWKYHNSKEEERFSNFKKRSHHTLPFDRIIESSEEAINYAAEAIICIGNEATRQTYSKFENVFALPIACYEDAYNKSALEITNGQRNFLFYSGGGNIHKGLDLILEAFAGSVLDLYICSSLDSEFESYYKKLLYEAPNIHYCGLVDPRSPQFYEIMKKCTFSLLASCSEGNPGSVVECMQRGLIPLVTEESHLDVDGFGLTIEEGSVAGIKKIITKASRLDYEQLIMMSSISKKAAETNHSIKNFETSLAENINKIMAL
jgi:glycosyltransferase involved in cell wall biosynthesis